MRRGVRQYPRAATGWPRPWARWRSTYRHRASRWKRKRNVITCPSRFRLPVSFGGCAAASRGARRSESRRSGLALTPSRPRPSRRRRPWFGLKDSRRLVTSVRALEAHGRLRAAQAAAAKGRRYLGSAEGEYLQVHFKPPWSRAPDLDMARRGVPCLPRAFTQKRPRRFQVLPGGSAEDRAKAVAAAKRAAVSTDRVDFTSYADFQVAIARCDDAAGASAVLRWQAHLLEWGMRCIVTRVFTPVVLLAYQWQLSRIAGGARRNAHGILL